MGLLSGIVNLFRKKQNKRTKSSQQRDSLNLPQHEGNVPAGQFDNYRQHHTKQHIYETPHRIPDDAHQTIDTFEFIMIVERRILQLDCQKKYIHLLQKSKLGKSDQLDEIAKSIKELDESIQKKQQQLQDKLQDKISLMCKHLNSEERDEFCKLIRSNVRDQLQFEELETRSKVIPFLKDQKKIQQMKLNTNEEKQLTKLKDAAMIHDNHLMSSKLSTTKSDPKYPLFIQHPFDVFLVSQISLYEYIYSFDLNGLRAIVREIQNRQLQTIDYMQLLQICEELVAPYQDRKSSTLVPVHRNVSKSRRSSKQ